MRSAASFMVEDESRMSMSQYTWRPRMVGSPVGIALGKGNWLYRQGYIKDNPIERVDMPKMTKVLLATVSLPISPFGFPTLYSRAAFSSAHYWTCPYYITSSTGKVHLRRCCISELRRMPFSIKQSLHYPPLESQAESPLVPHDKTLSISNH
jgi:hypothetical protein